MSKDKFKKEMQETIGKVLKENKHKIISLSPHSIWFIKRYSEKLAFYINCFDNRERKGGIEVTLYFTGIVIPDDSISTFRLGLKIPITNICPILEASEDHRRMIIKTDFEIPKEQMIGAGRKIVDIENSMSADTANMILEEMKNPYISNVRMEWYSDLIQIYDALNEDLEWKEEFELLKQECYRNYKKKNKYEICSNFVDKLPENYFKEKGIMFKFNFMKIYESESHYIKNKLSEYLDAQCIFGRISGKELKEYAEKEIVNKQQCMEVKQAIREILEDFNIKTKKDFMSMDMHSGLYEALKAGVLETYSLNDNEMDKFLEEVLEG